ncbi:MAG: LptA/OstA family protein [bacterium]
MRLAAAALVILIAVPALRAAADDPKTPGSPSDTAERLGLRFTPNAELVIASDEAEGVKTEKGQESVVFSKHVRARQGDMNLECDWLEAVYPQSAGGRPDKITARGAVVITQGTNQARCTDAAVDNIACTAECTSAGQRATLHRGADDVEANAIYFDLCKGTVRAVGDVLIRVRERPPEKPAEPPPAAAPPATEPKPGGA